MDEPALDVMDSPQPIFVPHDAETHVAVCQDCEFEKNRTGWARDEDRSAVEFTVELPLDQDRARISCPYGHEQLAVRLGTEAAERFL